MCIRERYLETETWILIDIFYADTGLWHFIYFRTGYFEVNPELLQSLEEGAASPSSDEEPSDEEEDPEPSERDWEHVPVTLPDMDNMPGGIDPYQSTSPVHSRPVDPAAAGGLMSSAAASVASLWRAATSRRDK